MESTIVPENTTSEYTPNVIRDYDISMKTLIAIYSIIFLLAVFGNSLVILTLVQNIRMRTVTNVFLLNLAISDLLLAVFCMPFTLIPLLIRNFVFGPFICVAIRYAQGTYFDILIRTITIIMMCSHTLHARKNRIGKSVSHDFHVR